MLPERRGDNDDNNAVDPLDGSNAKNDEVSAGFLPPGVRVLSFSVVAGARSLGSWERGK